MRLLHKSQETIHHSPSFALPGKVALITGGGTGIGRGIALALARRGAHVALVGRRAAPLLATADEVLALGMNALPIPLDITDGAAGKGLLPAVRAGLGGLDILVHSAGVLAGGPLATQDAAAVAAAIATNLTAAIDLTRLAQAELMERRGALVFVGSAMAFVPLPHAALYAASKAGQRGFAQAIRYEMEPAGVRVLFAAPPGTATAMLEQTRAALPRTPFYRLEDPERAGERIVAALVAGRKTLLWGGERWLIGLHRLAPQWVERVLMRVRSRFAW